MTYYFMVHNGLPDCLPNATSLHSCETIEEANDALLSEIEQFCSDGYGHKALDFHGFGPSSGSASMWDWILAFQIGGAEELQVTGLTEQEFLQAQGAESSDA